MKAVLKPITDTLDILAKGINANTRTINALAKRPPPEPPSVIPKELAALLPDIINGGINAVVSFFSQPSVDPAAASKGIFGETMQKAYEASMIKTWNATADLQELAVETAKLENKLRAKRLDEDI